ncbi:hypothetical protein PR202_gb25705 [Eleusine coracana subsp. coracana]|uniref:Retrotransposon gag domain-containing protein n=1 Tax=Eleusine coracana subsp. coracana TaxID=191504 RepID=A0AAV5FMB6_ELECO|nr:hypothetical protein PR202_gb25705 [Eleusine coracana subsp. coracana]
MDEIPSTLTMKNVLGTTDAMRKNAVIRERTIDGMTDKRTIKILLQGTTVMTDIDVMIGIGAIMMIMTIDVVIMMTMLVRDMAVVQLSRWPKGFKLVPIEKYDGQTNPREWLQLYSTAIRWAGGDSYVMANYLPVCLDPAVRIWLISLPEESITCWGDLNRKLIESFQATCNRPGNHFDRTRIKQKNGEPLHDYIKQFCAKKTEIPNVPDQQIIAAFQGGIRSDDLVREIGRRNHDLKLTAQECFEIADKFASGESALDDIRGKGKEKRSDKPESSKKDKKRKPDNMVHMVHRLQKNPRTSQPSTDELLSGPIYISFEGEEDLARSSTSGVARGVGTVGLISILSTKVREVSSMESKSNWYWSSVKSGLKPSLILSNGRVGDQDWKIART